MRADAITFEDVFQIDLSSGRISLGKDRYIMFDADAVGSMRRELIDNLGLEVARGILERVGYQCGRNNARQLRERYPWPSEEEWLRAGPRLHYLEGMVNVRVGRVDISRADGRFHMTGDWVDSYEAEQHLKHYGSGPHTVCWTLEGFATGYASEFFGRRIVCLETQCRGRGDPICSYELRPAEEWGAAARPLQEMLAAVRFTERFDRCLRTINDMGCELEQTSLDAIVTTDSKGIITSCSEGACDLLGMLPGEPTGRKVSDFYRGGVLEAREVMERLRRAGRFRNYLTEVRTPGGQRVPIALSASAIRNSAGQLVGTIGVAHNLTEIRKLEDELGAKNRFMANILLDSADAIVTLDPNDVITSWNRGAEIIFGFSAGEAVGRSIEIIIPQELRDSKEYARIAAKVISQGAVRNYQAERVTKDGRRIQVIFTRTAIRDDQGRIIGSSAVIKDVTSYRTLERQLADAEHLATLGELSAGLAHEIKNPLAGIKGAIDVIRDSMPSEDAHREILGDVLHEVNRIDRIVRDLLNYAKPKPPSHTDINLPELAQRMVAMARQSSKDERHRIEVVSLREIPRFTGDETQLEQVLLNLLLNALNAVPSDGVITVRLDYDSKSCCI
ncbi:MAG TPA: PAS domain S-box protein, partial [Acidobacteriota bacterium]|nr:PAS domain S-box protein [Acidobacteriota bacterium]